MSELSKGTGIANYEVRQLLGKGASACVYEGFDKTKKIEVAIKMIEKKQIKSRHLHNRVKQEVAIHFRLKHPSILELYDVFQDSHYVYLILELCHKGQMQQYLDSHAKTLTEDEARVVMHQIIEGFLYLHSHGIVHRDLSLANLLLTKDMNVKISDFGMSTTLEDPNQQHYTLCGTPNFMSPEIASRSAHGQGTDVWSLGVILYVCLVGKRPFESVGVHSTLKRVVQGEYELPNTLSPEARDLITKMLRKADDRISLQDIVTHPFMRVKSTASTITKKIAEMSMDSGCGTISSTKHSSSGSCSNMYAPSRRTQPMPAFPLQQETHRDDDRSYTSIDSGSGSTRSLTYLSHSSSVSDRHPSSPPVRERDSQSEEELQRTRAAMRNIKFLSKPQNIHFPAHGETEAKPAIHGCQSWNEQFTAAKSGASDAAEAATDQMHFHSLPPNDHQKVERQYQAFDPCRYKDPDCTSNFTNSAFRPVQHNNRTDKYGHVQQTSQISSVYPENMQTQDLASKAFNFLAKDETQQRLKSSQPVEFVYNKVPIQFLSPEPASRSVRLTEKEIQHCLMESNKTTPKSENKRDSKEFYSLPPPFSTEGLTPVRSKSKSSVLHIMDNGSIVLEFMKKGKVERISDVITISSDGMRIMRYKPAGAVPVSDQPPPLPPPEQCETFVYPNIPEKYLKKYSYAAKMIKVLRDKKPKVTVYARRAKCCLMENAALHMEFYDGVIALSDDKSVQIKETDGTSLTLSSAELNPRLSPETLEMLTYVQQCRDMCLKVEAAISSVQALLPGADRLFPIVTGRRPRGIKLAHKNVQALDDDKQQLGPNSVSETTNLQSMHSKKLETPAWTNSVSVASSPGSDSDSAQVRLKTNQGSASNVEQRKVGDSFLKGSHSSAKANQSLSLTANQSLSTTANQSLNTTASTTISRANFSSSSDNSSARVELRGADIRSQTFVPGVGWASKKVNGEIEILFQDGTRLDLKTTKFTHWTVSGSCCEYNYHDDPPAVVREKLRLAGEVAKTLQAKSTSVLSSSSSSK